MTHRDSNGRFARAPAAMKASVRRAKATPAHVEPDSHDVSATKYDIAMSLIDRGLATEGAGPALAKAARAAWDKGPIAPLVAASLSDRPQTMAELQACVTGRCRGASLALSDIIRIDPKGQSTNYREALARYTVWTEARTMAQSVIDAQARDKRRRGLWSRIFG